MREILFRGKRVDSGEWVEGFYMKTKRSTLIVEEYSDDGINVKIKAGYDVKTETVSQYTGLKDCNGKRIFEGDIVKEKGVNAICIVFDERTVSLGWVFLDYFKSEGRIRKLNKNHMSDMEIIGNSWDNPELLEAQG